MGGIREHAVWKRFVTLIKIIFAIVLIMQFAVISWEHRSRYDYVYGLPENTIPLYLEEGTFLWSVNDHIQNKLSLRFGHLSGAALAGEISVEDDQTVLVAARETIGQLKLAFVSPLGTMTLVEVSEDASEISLPAASYEVYGIGERFWGEVTLTFHDAK